MFSEENGVMSEARFRAFLASSLHTDTENGTHRFLPS